MKKLFIGMFLLGLVIMLGTAGASDTGMAFGQVIIRGSVGIACMVLGFCGFRATEE